MSAAHTARRVVTGLDADGQSRVIIDGPPVPMSGSGGMVWRTAAIPADNSGTQDIDDTPFDFALMHSGGSGFMVVDYPPGMSTFWHATDTIDYIVVLKGEVVLALETGDVTLQPGDFVVDRGVNHAWRNDTADVASIAVINLPALPVGKGRTV